MSLERQDIRDALLKKGFREQTDSDHDRYFLYVGEKKQAVFTKLSRGGKHRTYGDPLVSAMAKQLKLTKPDLRKLVECSIDGEAYIGILDKSGVKLSR